MRKTARHAMATLWKGFGLVPSLTGTIFSNRWGDKSADQLANSVNRMPPGAEGSLDPSEYTQILAYVLEHNGYDCR